MAKVREESKIKPRLRAEAQGTMGGAEGRVIVGLAILLSCCRKPISMNSVLDGLRVSRLDVIQEEIVEMVDCNTETAIA